jgi:hypothetical protein
VTDDLEQEVRRRLHGASLPAAPTTLREEIEHLRSVPAASATVRSSSRPPMVLLAAALATVALAVAALGLAGSTRPTPLPSTAPPTPPARTYGFTRPGFAFDPPSGWTDQSTAISFPVIPEQRFVGYLVHGMTSCPGGYGSLPPKPSGCEEMATKPGTATLSILELNHQYPWLPNVGQESTIARYPARLPGETGSGWLIQSPDGGIYQLSLIAPRAEMAENAATVGKALDSLQLTNWEASPTVVNGLIHEDPGQGFSFDYPAGWVRYYPTDTSMMDAAVVTVASAPVLPPCLGDICQRFTTPPGAIVIEFRVGNGPTSPDWSKATNRIGGQPAFGPSRWGPQNATSAQEGHDWSVRLGDRPILGIDASLTGPGLPALRTAMNQVIKSIKITGP